MPFTGDQHSIQALAAGAADPRSAIAFARGAYAGVRTVCTPMAVNTASNAAVNLLSRSRIKPLAVYHGKGLIADEPSVEHVEGLSRWAR